MKSIFSIKTSLLLIVFLVGCNATEPTANVLNDDGNIVSNGDLMPSDAPVVAVDPNQPRAAFLAELENDLEARQSENEDFSPAELGLMLGEGGQAISGAETRARFDLLPDGTIVRMGPNTEFTLTELASDPTEQRTKLSILVGKIWVLLNGGEFTVETASGLATVRGSMMSIEFLEDTGDMAITCLTGHCTLENELGYVEMEGGQASSIPGEGQAPNDPYPMSDADYAEWEAQVPESKDFEEHRNQDHPELGPVAGGEPGNPGDHPQGPDPDKALTDPITYNFVNECKDVWHWEFTGDSGTYTVDVPAYGSASGEIPPGIYQVTDWNDAGFYNGPYESIGGSHFDTTFHCPAPGEGGEPPPPPTP